MRPSLSGWVEGQGSRLCGDRQRAASMRPSLSGWVEVTKGMLLTVFPCMLQ